MLSWSLVSGVGACSLVTQWSPAGRFLTGIQFSWPRLFIVLTQIFAASFHALEAFPSSGGSRMLCLSLLHLDMPWLLGMGLPVEYNKGKGKEHACGIKAL